MTTVKVSVSAEVAGLMRSFFIDCQPPYFYLRCKRCDLREFLPWDPRIRTREAIELLQRHGKQCAEAGF